MGLTFILLILLSKLTSVAPMVLLTSFECYMHRLHVYLYIYRCYVLQTLKQMSLPQKEKYKLLELEKKLLAFAEVLKLNLKDAKPSKRKVVAKCFNLIGISVPYDKRTEVGYRPLPVSNSEQHCLLSW